MNFERPGHDHCTSHEAVVKPGMMETEMEMNSNRNKTEYALN